MARTTLLIAAVAMSIVLIGATGAFAEESSGQHRPQGHFGVGAGLGVRNGFGGVGFEASPIEYLSFTAGVGFVGVTGYSVGIQAFPIGRSSKVRPYVSATAGEAVAPFGFGVDGISYIAFGVGGEVGFSARHTLEFGLDFLTGDESFVFPTVAWKFHF